MKILLVIALSLSVLLSFGQITIKIDDINQNIPRYAVQDAAIDSVQAPAEGENNLWDYRNIKLLQSDSIFFEAADNPAFPISDWTRQNLFDEVVNGMGYFYDAYYALATNMVLSGKHVRGKAYDLSPVTFSPGDSLKFTDINYSYSSEVVVRKFPMTYQTSWSNSYVEEGNFELTVKFYGLSKAAGLRKTNVQQDFEVVGWGKLILPFDSNYSLEYPVLMLKKQETKIDSFYIDGKPASPLMMAAFGLQQGALQQEYSYMFLSNDRFQPLMQMWFKNATFKNIESIKVDMDIEETFVPEMNINELMVYPNPFKNSFSLSAKGRVDHIEIFDLNGKIVYTRTRFDRTDFQMEPDLFPGVYFLRITNINGEAFVQKIVKVK